MFGGLLLGSSLSHSKALSLGGDDGGVVGESIEQSGGELLVAAEDFDPFSECEVGGDDDASTLIAFGEQVEEQLAASAIEGDEAQLVNYKKFDLLESSLKTPELASVARLEQRSDDIRGAGEENASSLTCGFDIHRARARRSAWR